MQAMILAAGMGKHLEQYTKDVTKCMVCVNGKTLIEYAVEALINTGIKKIIIVTGYKGEKLRTFLNKTFAQKIENGLKFSYIKNKEYASTNNIYSLYLARKQLQKDDTLLLESDIIFDESVIKNLLKNKDKNIAVVSRFERWMNGTCTKIDENQNIIEVLDKANFEWSEINNYYKTVNIYKFSKEFSKQYYIPFLEAYQKSFGKNEYYEIVLKVLASLNTKSLKAMCIRGDEWYEINDPADLAVAENRFAPAANKLQLMEERYGGYWRFPQIKDFCYLVNPFFPPAGMIDELKSSFKTLLCSYPSGSKQQSLLASKIFNIQANHIIVGNGAAELINSIGRTLYGKTLVLYPTFNEYSARFSEPILENVSKPKYSFDYTVEEIIEKAKKNNVSNILLINPDNPTGHYFNKKEVISLLSELKKLKIRLIYDESFTDFAEQSERFTIIEEKNLIDFPNLVVIKSISKSYGVPGLRLGILATSDSELINRIDKTNSIWDINSFAEYFLQIYDKYKSTYEYSCDKIAEERERFTQLLSQIKGVYVYKSQANYVLCRLETKITASTLAIKLLQKHNILIKDLSPKAGFENGQFIRLAVLSPQDDDALINAIKEELK